MLFYINVTTIMIILYLVANMTLTNRNVILHQFLPFYTLGGSKNQNFLKKKNISRDRDIMF